MSTQPPERTLSARPPYRKCAVLTLEQQAAFGHHLKWIRIDSGFTVKALAAVLECHPSHWYSIERGRWLLSLDMLIRFARVVRVKVADCVTVLS
jgi:DNA-binding XRE family transcriptional regulator